MIIKKSINLMLIFLLQIATVTAHGIGESFEALTDFFLIRLIFGNIHESVGVFQGIILDEVAGFIIHVIFWYILFLLTLHQFSKFKTKFNKKQNILASILIVIIISHTKIIFLFVYLLSLITKKLGDFAGIVSISISYLTLILVVYYLYKVKARSYKK